MANTIEKFVDVCTVNRYDFIVNAYNFIFNDLRRVGYKWENFCRFIPRTMWLYALKN